MKRGRLALLRNLLWSFAGVWTAGCAVVAWGFWETRQINDRQCEAQWRTRYVTEQVLVHTFEDLGAELHADDHRVERFTDRIRVRFDHLPDPC